MKETIQITGILNLPVESSVTEPKATSPRSEPKEVIRASIRNESYPKTGEMRQNELLFTGIWLLLIAIVIFLRERLKAQLK